MSIHHIRIDYDNPNPPGIFVIRCNAKGEITRENKSLAYRQLRHGADTTLRSQSEGSVMQTETRQRICMA